MQTNTLHSERIDLVWQYMHSIDELMPLSDSHKAQCVNRNEKIISDLMEKLNNAFSQGVISEFELEAIMNEIVGYSAKN